MRVRLLSVGMAVAAALSGCGGDDEEPKSLPPVSVAPSPTASAGPSVPPSASAATPTGASAFARHWFDVLNAAARTGDTTTLRALAAPGCVACTRFAESIDHLYTDGGGIAGGVFTVVVAETPALEPNAREAAVTVVYDIAATQQLNKDGTARKSVPASKGNAGEMRLVRTGDSWLVRELTRT